VRQNLLQDVKIICILKLEYKGEIYPEPGGSQNDYTQAKVYCPISLLSFMEKTMQKLVARNIKDETLGHVPYIYNNLPTNQGRTQKPQCTT